MPTTSPKAITASIAAEPPSTIQLRTAHLRRRHRLAPAVAAVIADLAYATSPSWVGRRA